MKSRQMDATERFVVHASVIFGNHSNAANAQNRRAEQGIVQVRPQNTCSEWTSSGMDAC